MHQWHLDKGMQKRADFQKALKELKLPNFDQFDEAILVIGGTLFSRKFRDKCKVLNVRVCYPSRGRYHWSSGSQLDAH